MAPFPNVGDIVVVKVSRVLNYGVFVDLLDNDGLSGFIHISEIASRWTKNIRNHVKENQIRAAKIISINLQKRQIDLSLTKVSSETERGKIEEWKRGRRARKLIEVLSEKRKIPFESVWKSVAEPLIKQYESLYDAFQVIAMDGPSAATGVPKEFLNELAELCKTGFEIPEKSVEGLLAVSSMTGDGVERVKQSLKAVQDFAKDEKIELFYTGSGKYLLRVFALDYKTAEKLLSSASDAGVKKIESLGGTGSFQKTER
ncbi:MAG: translation initiation factor IF-2 subunit alpha [Candidatus Diapherotrites archaeon]|uniref:Translation initiation factor IF-2 subunit alpha n=1 Tax=Candidatus Iainarchaeum sp. TaxID=3101447 RepID=A0A8T4L185_9ARCH|nr:translation initiation factor IF-2 subunit alpha [Candidatus Diapherotrites archaeon]